MHKRVLSLGAGVQSTTVYLLALDGKIPSIHAAIFADTQEEPDAVYDHLRWLMSLGGPEIFVRSRGCLGDDLLSGKRVASIPAYTAMPGVRPSTGMVPRQCTQDYKIRIVEQAIRRDLFRRPVRRGLTSQQSVSVLFGISTDEAGRAQRIARRERRMAWNPAFPLLDLKWSRRDCENFLAEHVPHPVPKSACVFCPYHNNATWRKLKATDAVGWERACEIDAGIRASGNLRELRYLHPSAVPLAEVNFDALALEDSRQGWLGFARECEGMCGL